MEALKIKFENWNFGKLFRNGIFIKINYLTLKDEIFFFFLKYRTLGHLGGTLENFPFKAMCVWAVWWATLMPI